jgi:hypothetical protein
VCDESHEALILVVSRPRSVAARRAG